MAYPMDYAMDWTDVPICFQSIPDPRFSISVHGDQMPVICFPEEYLSPGLQGQSVQIWMPLGFFLKPGNMKAVPAGHMIDRALATGRIKRGQTLVEPTSGGMGVALAYFAKKHGIHVIAIVADNLPRGKLLPLSRHGATVLKESEVVSILRLDKSPGSIKLAELYAEQIDAVFLNQYANEWNPESYRELIARQLWVGVGGHASMLLSSVGSRGTLIGLGTSFRQWNPDMQIVGVMPYHGQNIDGTRTWFRQKDVSHDLKQIEPYVLERIDEAAADKYADYLNKLGIPVGRSGGGGYGSAEHLLLTMVEEGTIDRMRSPRDGVVRIILPVHDTRYPYDPV